MTDKEREKGRRLGLSDAALDELDEARRQGFVLTSAPPELVEQTVRDCMATAEEMARRRPQPPRGIIRRMLDRISTFFR